MQRSLTWRYRDRKESGLGLQIHTRHQVTYCKLITHVLDPFDNVRQTICPLLLENIRVPSLNGSNVGGNVLSNFRWLDLMGSAVVFIERESSAKSTDSVERRKV